MAASDNEGLEVSIEISHQRMLQRVAQIEARLFKLADRADSAFKKTNNSAVKGFERTAKASKQMTGNLRNMSQQLSQVVQQAQAGTGVFSALAMQLPDMVAFGGPAVVMLGAIAGGIATIAINSLNAADGVDEFKKKLEALETILKDLESSFSQQTLSIDEMNKKYGEQAGAIQQLINKQAELIALRAQDALTEAQASRPEVAERYSILAKRVEEYNAALSTMTDLHKERGMNEINKTIAAMSEQLKISKDDALTVSQAFLELWNAKGSDELQAALVGVYEELDRSGAKLESFDKETREWLETMGVSVERLALVDQAMQNVLDTANSVGTAIKTWTLGNDFASGLLSSVKGAWEFAKSRAEAADSGSTSTRKGGGGKKASPSDIYNSGQQSIAGVERQIEVLGLAEQKVVELTAKWRLMDEAKRKGISLNAQVAETGKTVAETIDEQAAKIGELTAKYQQANEKQQFFDSAQQQLNTGIIDSIVHAKDFGDVLDDLAKKLAAAALEAALFGSGPFGGMGFFGGGLFPTAAGGNTARAGQAMLINENTPHSEVFVPSGNGGVLNVNQAQAALKQAAKGSGGGTASVELVVRQEPGTVVEIARQQAATVVTEYDATLPSRVNKINGDPRAI